MKKALLIIALAIVIVPAVFAQVNLNLGLRAYYPFSGNANDVSGNNNNPVFNNATLTADRLGNPNSAYHFNGTNTYMRIPNSPTINMGNTMSIALWVKPMGFYTGTCHNNMLVMKGDADYLTGNYYTRFTPDPLPGCVSNPDLTRETFWGPVAFSPSPFIQLNRWYSVIWTYDGVNGRIYIDCELKSTNAITITTFTNAFDLFLGRLNDGTYPYWLNGDLDEVRIYNRALNVDEVNTLGGCIVQTPCNNWLNTPSNPSYARIGDLDVSGNQLTIEATYNRTQPLNSGLYPGHLVSKHSNTADCNYALFPNGCSVTTTNGYKETFENCPLTLNKTYHVAMVYDGSFLKFYRNGFLHSQVACTGNLTLNNLQATIAQYANAPNTDAQFLGTVNEVRIWNVARTQAQLQTYMNSSLVNPTTIPGLLGYYTFDNLVNKQGNATFNATLNGAATINATNPSCTFVADSCQVITPCNSWLRTPTHPSTASIGNLNVSGNQITVEGSFNCTAYSTPNFGGNLIAKHTDASNVTYALSPHGAEIRTSNSGYVFTLQTCPFELNKTYHVAMVYDGAALKFYRNGFLMSQVACSGTINTNSLQAIIGNGPAFPLVNQFFGYLNEIRVWNVARSQAQIQTYMNTSLPNPTTQTGLLAYYTFDNLLNKQGNAAWNATLAGGATINNTNPNCTFVATSCPVVSSVIINSYTPVTAFNPCDNRLTVEDASTFNVGDTVLIIQMKGAVIDSTNTAAFGTITDYKNAGNYEFNYVKTKAGNIIELKNALIRQYDIPVGKVQLVRVPYYNGNVTFNDTLTCLPWDGSKGGVLVFNVLNSLTLNQNMDVSGKGFSGGIDPVSSPAVFNCNENQFYYPQNPDLASGKGEGIADISVARSFGKGALANGGGGGNSHNSGGAGGGNISAGGFGGYQLEGSPCNTTVPFDNRGIGGKALTYSNPLNKIFLGGGGGAGQTNNPEAFQAKGGNGGGIVIVSAGSLTSNGKKIISNGNNAPTCGLTTAGCHEGMGGGGAAGSVLLRITNYTDNANIEAKGGKGGDMTAAGFTKVGPGGGGSGGMVWLSNASMPANVSVSNTAGLNGVCTAYSNDPWGATAGTVGTNLFNLVLPVSTVAFKPNIDSVRINESLLSCKNFDFRGLAYTNANPIATWQWFFGDGGQATTQNTTHTYTSAGTYNVKLVVTDMNGCKDSIIKALIVTSAAPVDAGSDATICQLTLPAIVQLNASPAATYAWSPAGVLNNPAIQNPVATISTNTRFYVTVTDAQGCTGTDSVLITLGTAPPNTRYSTLSAFPYQNLQLQARSIGGSSFLWLPNIGLNNNTIANPVFYYTQSQDYTVRINMPSGCVVVDTQLVTMKGTKGIYVPKGFSPNGDGNNDRLYPICIGIKQLNYFKVYNRWGNLLFETTSYRPEDGWDGTFKGKRQPVETYTWVVEGIDIDNIVIRKNGNTLLIH